MTEELTKDGLPILPFARQSDFEAWLGQYHSVDKGIWLKFAKKGSGIASVSLEEAIESALCYGWIDSRLSSFDQRYYLIKFCPRLPKSKWSRMNREKAEALIATGRMQPPGLRQVERARQDGRWDAAYDPQGRITIPGDFQQALQENAAAAEFFSTLNSQNRFSILHRLQITHKPEARSAKIRKYIQMLANHEKIHP